MARGKQAAMAATRRLEAAIAHIDRITDELVDAKLRARQHEAATRLVPVLRAEIEKLTRWLDEGTCDRIVKLEATVEQLHTELREGAEYVDAVKKHWEKAACAFVEGATDQNGSHLPGVDALLRLLGDGAANRTAMSDVQESVERRHGASVAVMPAFAGRRALTWPTELTEPPTTDEGPRR